MVLPDDPETTKRNRYFFIIEGVNITVILRAVDVLVLCQAMFQSFSVSQCTDIKPDFIFPKQWRFKLGKVHRHCEQKWSKCKHLSQCQQITETTNLLKMNGYNFLNVFAVFMHLITTRKNNNLNVAVQINMFQY